MQPIYFFENNSIFMTICICYVFKFVFKFFNSLNYEYKVIKCINIKI